MSSSQQTRNTVGTSYGEDSDHWMMDYDEVNSVYNKLTFI